MAKKRKTSTIEDFPGVTFTSEVIRHVNEMTIPADSTTAVAESIPTPGYSEVGYSGCFIVAVQFSPAPATAKMAAPGDVQWCVQIQTGDRTATPALLNPNDVGFFAQLITNSQITTSGFIIEKFPQAVPVSMPVPIIVLPDLTVCHDATANVAEIADAVVYTEIFYRTVRLDDRAYTGLLLQQQRTS